MKNFLRFIFLLAFFILVSGYKSQFPFPILFHHSNKNLLFVECKLFLYIVEFAHVGLSMECEARKSRLLQRYSAKSKYDFLGKIEQFLLVTNIILKIYQYFVAKINYM